jgi:hypothetical protein
VEATIYTIPAYKKKTAETAAVQNKATARTSSLSGSQHPPLLRAGIVALMQTANEVRYCNKAKTLANIHSALHYKSLQGV